MHRRLLRWSLPLAAAMPMLSAQAGVLTLTGWEYGTAGVVRVSSPAPSGNLLAGALRGELSGLTGEHAHFNGDLVTYCVELTQRAPAWHRASAGYSVVSGLDHFGVAHRGNRLGSFMTYVSAQSLFDVDDPRARNSTAVQLAIWNILYDDDSTLRAGSMRESINGDASRAATMLLAGWERWQSAGGRSGYDVYVLHHASDQDFLLLRESAGSHHNVPLPGTLALLVPALVSLALVRRRRG